MFRACELVVVNKIDLLPHLDFDLDRFLHNLDAVQPGRRARCSSARAPARASRRSATGSRAWPPRGARRRDGAGRRRGRRRELLARRTEANERFFAARGRADRAPLPRGWPSASRAAGG